MLFHEASISERLAKTCFLTSVVSFLAFLLAEVVRPGFVSRTFSVYIFLLAAIVFGYWWVRTEPVILTRRVLWWVIAFLAAIGFVVIVWNLTRGLEERPILVSIAFFAPFLTISLAKTYG